MLRVRKYIISRTRYASGARERGGSHAIPSSDCWHQYSRSESDGTYTFTDPKKKTVDMGIEELTKPYDNMPGDCGDVTRALHTVLVGAGVKHRVMLGYLLDQHSGEQFAPHMWIELEDGRVVDYRARMWLGSKEYVPHGVFAPAAFPGVEHHGMEVKISTLEPQKLSGRGNRS